MTATRKTHRGGTALGRASRSRSTRFVAAAVAAGITISAVASSGAGPAGAAALPKAQSVGRFLDGSVGGNAIQKLADVKDARAKSPGSQSVQNPLDVTLLDALDVPLTGALQLPSGGLAKLGAANQVAVAKSDGFSYGGSGAVSNSGGVSLGAKNTDFPANATLTLNASALGGSTAIPGLPKIPGLPTGLPGAGDLSSLGGITASIGAVDALAQTKSGGAVVTPHSSIASVNLTIGSPALGALLQQVTGLLDPSVLSGILGTAGTLTGGKCALTATIKPTITLDGGAVTIDIAQATISVDVAALLKVLLGKDLTNLATSNFDLVTFLVKNLPKILTTGLEGVINGITNPLATQFTNCVGLLGALGAPAAAVLALLQGGQTTFETALNGLAAQLGNAGTSGLTTLASGLEKVIDIGLNVQSGPGIQKHDTTYPFTSALKATPDQATAVVKNQTLVRAIEVDLLDTSALGSLPAVPKVPTFAAAVAVKSAGAVVALGNAAAGPSAAAVVAAPTTPAPTTTPANVPSNAIPTGVPAGEGRHGGSPVLPIVLGLLALTLAGGGVIGLRARGRFSR